MRTRLLIALAASAVASLLLLGGEAGAHTLRASLTVHVVGEGTVRAPGIACGAAGNTCATAWDGTSAAKMTATGTENSVFAGWTGSCSGTQSTCLLVITDGADADVTAVFGYVEVLDLETAGSGEGTVVSKPAGINCGQVCAKPFAANTRITLTAIPKRGSVFTGWSGWCSGKGDCTVQTTYGTAWLKASFERKASSAPKPAPAPRPRAFTVGKLGSFVSRANGGMLIVVRFNTSHAAAARLGLYRSGNLLSSTDVAVRPGPVTVRLPLGSSAAPGRYTVLASLTSSGVTRTLRWDVTVPG